MGAPERRRLHNLILTVLEPIEGAGHGLSGEYAALINEQADYFLWWAMDLGNAQR